MNTITKSIIVSVAMLAAGCSVNKDEGSSTKSAGVPVGEIRGYQAISTDVKARLFTPSTFAGLELSRVLSFVGEIQTFMGSFLPGTGEFVNGTPNSVNVMLWDMTMTNVAGSLAALCGRTPEAGNSVSVAGFSPTVLPEVATIIRNLCLAPDDAALDPELDALWAALMMLDAPDEELAPWKEFVKSSRASYETPQAWVRGSVRAIFMSPYFLLNP